MQSHLRAKNHSSKVASSMRPEVRVKYILLMIHGRNFERFQYAAVQCVQCRLNPKQWYGAFSKTSWVE